ncbi:MAG TPA: hypothetical protein VHZ56_01030 [Devosia sp.]|nr:hypothetical protein [Devosia sp.]
MTRRTIPEASLLAARASRDRMLERARRRGRVRLYRVHTAMILPLVGLLGLVPIDAASALGGWLGRWIIRRVAPARYLYKNVRVAFPALSDGEIDAMLAEMNDNIGRCLAEGVHLGAFAGRDNSRLRLVGLEHLAAAQAGGRGVLFVSGHFGNWELYEVALANLGLDGAKVLQHPSNPFILEWVAKRRYAFGLGEQIASGEGVFVRVRAALKAGRVVQMLADQRTVKGAKVEFFGVETTTNMVPARVAREAGAAIVLMSMRRLQGAHFEITFHPPRFVTMADDERAIMRWVNAFFEDQLRQRPAHWLWGHGRWDDVFLKLPAAPLVTAPDAG